MTKIEDLEIEKKLKGCVRRVGLSAGDRVVRKYRKAMIRRAEYIKLKAIVPAVAQKKSVTKLTVIEEAIKYINELHSALAEKLCDSSTADVNPALRDAFDPQQLFLRQLLYAPTTLTDFNHNMTSRNTSSTPSTPRTPSTPSTPSSLQHTANVSLSFPFGDFSDCLLPQPRQTRQPLLDVRRQYRNI